MGFHCGVQILLWGTLDFIVGTWDFIVGTWDFIVGYMGFHCGYMGFQCKIFGVGTAYMAGLLSSSYSNWMSIQCCIQLCQGRLTTSQLTESVLSLVSARPPRHLSDPSTPSLEDPNPSSQASEIIRMLNTLSDRATYAQQCCSCIITCFRIALVRVRIYCKELLVHPILQALNLSYASVINAEPFRTLTQLLGSVAPDRFVLASKFIATCNITPIEVCRYMLCYA